MSRRSAPVPMPAGPLPHRRPPSGRGAHRTVPTARRSAPVPMPRRSAPVRSWSSGGPLSARAGAGGRVAPPTADRRPPSTGAGRWSALPPLLASPFGSPSWPTRAPGPSPPDVAHRPGPTMGVGGGWRARRIPAAGVAYRPTSTAGARSWRLLVAGVRSVSADVRIGRQLPLLEGKLCVPEVRFRDRGESKIQCAESQRAARSHARLAREAYDLRGSWPPETADLRWQGRGQGVLGRGREEGPGATRRRGLSSPVLTRSPELPGSIPPDRCPRAVRLTLKISPRRRRAILEGGHSNEGCWGPERHLRMCIR